MKCAPTPAGPVIPTDICIEVTYARPHCALVKTFRLAAPASVADALHRAADDPEFAGIDLERAAVGIFGKLAHPRAALADGDRVEIYRPLAADPKSARRDRARRARR